MDTFFCSVIVASSLGCLGCLGLLEQSIIQKFNQTTRKGTRTIDKSNKKETRNWICWDRSALVFRNYEVQKTAETTY